MIITFLVTLEILHGYLVINPNPTDVWFTQNKLGRWGHYEPPPLSFLLMIQIPSFDRIFGTFWKRPWALLQ